MRKTYRNKSRKNKGGAATVMPLQYYNPNAQGPTADAGHDLLKAIPSMGIRPRIGGSQKRRRTKRTRGGFVPSIMGNFVAAASKYVVPIALFAGYKMLTRKGKRSSRRTQRK
jgi:hypothetical protein